jgi:excisionase family DNA binding protein
VNEPPVTIAQIENSVRRVLAEERARSEARLRELIAAHKPAPVSDVLTLAEAAAYLQMKPERLRRLCRANRIAFIRFHRRYTFKRVDLDEFLAVYRHPRRSVFH